VSKKGYHSHEGIINAANDFCTKCKHALVIYKMTWEFFWHISNKYMHTQIPNSVTHTTWLYLQNQLFRHMILILNKYTINQTV